GSGGACADGTALDAPASVAISPDGGSAYVASPSSDAVAIFARDVPPETTINSGPDGVIADNTPTFTFSSSEPGSAFQCKTDSGPFGPCSGPGDSNTTFALADGPHRFQVRAIDPAANIDPTAASRTFAVDTVGPKTKIGKRPKHKVRTRRKKARVTVRFTSEKGARFRCRLDRGKSFRCSSPYRVKAASKRRRGKKHRIVIKAIDRAGNVGKPAKVGFRVIREHRRR
ncbi:MAG: hypothetical protein KDB62_01720, partial [Solirubrobacterales bacterium]|nr:hypothetical protein [Solirubrobacterales bacterium]